LDLLLTLGSCITDLVLGNLAITESRASAACHWEKLNICAGNDALSMHQAAYLPLKTVQQLEQCSRSTGYSLKLPLSSVRPSQLPTLLHQAAINLAACPAWQKAMPPDVIVWNAEVDYDPSEHSWTSEQRVQLLRAMAPLRHSHLTGFLLDLDGWELGQPEVAALQHSFGAGLDTLVLGDCILVPSFWAALTELLPHVSDLQLRSSVRCHIPDVITLCSRRSKAHPFVLQLENKLYEVCGGDQVQDSLRAQGVGHVFVVEAKW
jgi:hypothetical protein